MVKVSTTKRKGQEDPNDIFASMDRDAARMGGDADKPEVKEEDEVSLKDLLLQIKTLNERVATGEQERLALMTQAPRVEDTPKAPGEMSIDGLPDPVAYPDEYAKELNKRIQASVAERFEYQTKQNNQARSQENRVKGLWDDFSIAHPDIAQEKDRVEFAAQKVAARAQARGIDLDRYMFANSQTFFRDIAGEYNKLFPKVEAQEVEEDANRSQSIFGGVDSMNRVQPKAPEKGDMIADLHNIQRKMGLF